MHSLAGKLTGKSRVHVPREDKANLVGSDAVAGLAASRAPRIVLMDMSGRFEPLVRYFPVVNGKSTVPHLDFERPAYECPFEDPPAESLTHTQVVAAGFCIRFIRN